MMNKYLKYSFYTLILLIVSCNKQKATKGTIVEKKEIEKDTTHRAFSEQDIIKHLSNRNDSTTWNLPMLDGDLMMLDVKRGPFTSGVFPEPRYDIIGKNTFGGMGFHTYIEVPKETLKLGGNTLLATSFYKSESISKTYVLENKRNGLVFFQIIVLTDFIDTVNYSHRDTDVISRNHPDYMGQGSFKTKNNQIEYAAFITHDNNSYAIVNTRLFDLKYGKTILIAPQKDRSLRSMQIKSPKLTLKQIEKYYKELLIEKEVIDFFTASGNI